MLATFLPRLDILPPPQSRLWPDLAWVPSEFHLYGGTALALYLGHRQSVDFDFFSFRPLDPMRLTPALPFLVDAEILQREPNTLSCLIDRNGPVKLSFFGVPRLPRLSAPAIAPDNGLRIASLLDLAGTKAAVVQMRAEAKDYLDIDALLLDGRVDLSTAIACALALYGSQYNPQSTLKALAYFRDGNLSDLPQAVRDRLSRAVRDVDLDLLPVVTASEGPDNEREGDRR